MKPETVNDRCARCSQSDDDLLLDAEAAAKALMADAAEVTALRARVKELEEALLSAKIDGNHSRRCAFYNKALRDCDCWKAKVSRALHRPTPSQERP